MHEDVDSKDGGSSRSSGSNCAPVFLCASSSSREEIPAAQHHFVSIENLNHRKKSLFDAKKFGFTTRCAIRLPSPSAQSPRGLGKVAKPYNICSAHPWEACHQCLASCMYHGTNTTRHHDAMNLRPTPYTPYGRRGSVTHMNMVRFRRFMNISFHRNRFFSMWCVGGLHSRPPPSKGTLNPKSNWLG